jgi:SAM-dependent MidA family methyltransferase
MGMNALEKKIIEKIGKDGPITFERFMETALYDPEYGYYSVEKVRIGREGDFYTSSHLHPSFAAMIGRQIAEMWDLMGRPHDFMIVEIAPGAGHACRDMLDSLKEEPLFSSLRYCLVERNPVVKEIQRTRLSEFSGRVDWFSSLEDLGKIRGCIFSNELLDAFPVHLVLMEDGLKEVYVTTDGSHLTWEKGAVSTPDITDYFGYLSVELERGYRTEVNLKIRDWLHGVNARLQEGFVLTIDYGYTARDYYSEDRNRGTLLCYHGHQMNDDPLRNVGEQDITAHVNFSSLRRWGEQVGLKTVGFCGQGPFLVSLGIEEEIRRLAGSGDYLFGLARIKRLIMPQGMGESHMVMVQYKGAGNPVLRGFSMRNQLRYL